MQLQARETGEARPFLPELGRLLTPQGRTVDRFAPPVRVAAEDEVEPTGRVLTDQQDDAPRSQRGVRGLQSPQRVVELEEVEGHHGQQAISGGGQLLERRDLERRIALLQPACFLEARGVGTGKAAVGAIEFERAADLRRE